MGLAAKPRIIPQHDDIQEAYAEAAEHLEMCACNCSVWENPEAMRAAYLLVAKRIRKAAKQSFQHGTNSKTS